MKPQRAQRVSLCSQKETSLKYKRKDIGRHRIDFLVERLKDGIKRLII